MTIDTLPYGLYGENTYVLHEAKEVLIIDPGCDLRYIQKVVGEDEKVVAVVLTHGHEDHTYAVDDVCDAYGCDVYMHTDDWMLVEKDNGKDVRGYARPVYHEIKPLQARFKLGKFDLTVYPTPGHTKGSVCIQIKDRLFTGDTLFEGSIGRTDLFGGDEREMEESLIFLMTLPNNLDVYPGHGNKTTIYREKMSNPFLRMLQSNGLDVLESEFTDIFKN